MLRASLAVVILIVGLQDSKIRVTREKVGPSERFDPARAEKAIHDLRKNLQAKKARVRRVSLSLEDPFDGKVPACRLRRTRTVLRVVPGPLVGKTMHWTPRGGKADVVFRTKARSLRELIRSGAAPADAGLARKWGVRCVPSFVTVKKDRVVIREGE